MDRRSPTTILWRNRTAAALAALLLGCGASAAADPQFVLPVDCEIGRTCFVQNYVDADPGPGARDFTCGSLSYQDHNGTDFRVLSLREQRAGVNVLAAAPGRVLRRRTDMADVSVKTIGPAAVKNAECGNGLVIRHEDGWETQYCHMAQGSILVAPGQEVAAGQPIGRVGLSGLTEYPHVHFTVRLGGKVVDPFAHEAEPGACRSGRSLWAPAVAEALAYRDSAVLNAGFAPAPMKMEDIEAGDLAGLAPDSAALVGYVRAIGLKKGDVQRLRITGPDGAVLIEKAGEPLARDLAQSLMFLGRRRPPAGWKPGRYAAEFAVIRNGTVALEHRFDVTL